MANRGTNKNRTKYRKARQAEQRRLEQLRDRVMGLADIDASRVAHMSPQELERRAKHGGRMRMVTPFDGIALALAAVAHAPKMFVRDGRPVRFENL